MKIKKLGILTLCFVLLVSTFTTPIAFAEENTESAAFARVEINEYGNKEDGTTVGNYTAVYALNQDPTNLYGVDYNSTAFGTNLWYQGVNSSQNEQIYNSNTFFIHGVGANEDRAFQARAHSNSDTLTGAYRKLATAIQYNADATYYFDFVSSFAAMGTNVPDEMRLGIFDNYYVSTGGGVASPEIKVFGGLKKHATASTYHAQVSLDGGTTVALSEGAFELGTKYHFLMRLDIDADGQDSLKLKVFADGAQEPEEWTVTTTGNIEADQNVIGFDNTNKKAVANLYKLDIDKYDSALLNSVQSTVDAAFANFKYSQADELEALIKTLPLGTIRTSYEAKLAALKEQTNTFFLSEDFESYSADLSPENNWTASGSAYYSRFINTLSKKTEAFNGWKENEGWSLYDYKQGDASGRLTVRFNCSPNDANVLTSLMTRGNEGAYRNFANSISKNVDGAYYFAFDLATGSDYDHQQPQVDARVMFALNGNYDTYVGLKYSYGDLSAQMNAGGALQIGAKEHSISASVRHILLTKLEVTNGNLVVKMKVYPKGGTEPAAWELVSSPIALTTDITGLGLITTAANVGFEMYEIQAEKYIGDNLTKLNAVKANIANATITTEAQIKEAIDVGFAQNELIASLGTEAALLFGQDVTFDSASNTVSLKVNNSRKASVDVTPVIALYQGEKMVGIKKGEEVTLTAQTPNQTVSVAYGTTAPEFDGVKVFFWNSMLNLKPVLEAWGNK